MKRRTCTMRCKYLTCRQITQWDLWFLPIISRRTNAHHSLNQFLPFLTLWFNIIRLIMVFIWNYGSMSYASEVIHPTCVVFLEVTIVSHIGVALWSCECLAVLEARFGVVGVSKLFVAFLIRNWVCESLAAFWAIVVELLIRESNIRELSVGECEALWDSESGR